MASAPSGAPARAPLPLDAALVPAGLLLIARELVLFQPTRELCWQLFHDTRVARKAAWLGPLLPTPSGALDADPLALLLAGLASGLALVYACAAWRGASVRVRAVLLGCASLVVVVPTLLVIGLGLAMKLPYGHDGGVVQLPLAMDKVLAGESPYAADYSRSVLGRQSRNSEFWAPLGGNPITRHHWYLPGVHVVMIPFYVVCRAALGWFDPRLVTLAGYLLAAWLASLLASEGERRLAAAAVVLVHPLVFWPQVFGVNDVLSAVPLLLAGLAAQRGQVWRGAAWVGFACAFKQLAWPFAPFLLVLLSGVASWRELVSPAGLRRLLGPVALALGVFALVVLPLAARDFAAFYADVFQYQVGLSGTDQYPLGGTPGFGFANFLIYTGAVSSLSDPYPFSRFYLLFVPLGLGLVHVLFRERRLSTAYLCGSAALLVSVYFSRIPNPNYLLLAALLVPIAVIVDRRWPADVAVVTLALLALGTEYPVRELMRTTWEHMSASVVPLPSWLAPGPGPRWRDPLSLALGSLAAGAAIAYLLAGLAGAARRVRLVLGLAALLALVLLPIEPLLVTSRVTGWSAAQDRWYADLTVPQVERLDSDPARPVEQAWPQSFRKADPQPFPPQSASPHRAGLRALLLGTDPRWLTVIALVVLGAWLWRSSDPLVLGLLLTPALAVGAVFGAGEAVLLAWLACGFLFESQASAGLTFGLAGGLGVPALGASSGLRGSRSLALAFAAALLLPVLLGLVHGPDALLAGLLPGPLSLSIGLPSVLAYWGLESHPAATTLAVLGWLSLCVGAAYAALHGRALSLPPAAVGSLAAVWLLPAEPHAVAVPIVLLALAGRAARERPEAG